MCNVGNYNFLTKHSSFKSKFWNYNNVLTMYIKVLLKWLSFHSRIFIIGQIWNNHFCTVELEMVYLSLIMLVKIKGTLVISSYHGNGGQKAFRWAFIIMQIIFKQEYTIMYRLHDVMRYFIINLNHEVPLLLKNTSFLHKHDKWTSHNSLLCGIGFAQCWRYSHQNWLTSTSY